MARRFRKLTILLGLSVMLSFGAGRAAYAAEPDVTETVQDSGTEGAVQNDAGNAVGAADTGVDGSGAAGDQSGDTTGGETDPSQTAGTDDPTDPQQGVTGGEQTGSGDEGTPGTQTGAGEAGNTGTQTGGDQGDTGSQAGAGNTGSETPDVPLEPGTTPETGTGSGSGAVTDPTDPAQPGTTDPTDPQQPGTTDPTDPTQPGTTDPTDPTQSGTTDPTDPDQPGTTDPEDPDEPGPIESVRDMIHFIGDAAALHSSDAILIESNGRFGLIDTSNPSASKLGSNDDKKMNGKVVAAYLKQIGVLHLDFVMGTHSHSDHIGGIPDLVKALNAEGKSYIDETTVYIFKDYVPITTEEQKKWYNGKHYAQAQKAMAGKGATFLHVNEPSEEALESLGASFATDERSDLADRITFDFGDFVIRLFNVHTPTEDNAYNKLTNENQNSIVTLVTKAATETDSERKVLLMADMESSDHLEQDITALIAQEFGSVDIMKAGHHGYYNAGSKEALENVSPSVYVVSKTLKTDNSLPSYYYLTEQGTAIYFQNRQKTALVADLTGGEIRMLTYNAAKELAADAVQHTQGGGWYTWYADKITADLITFYVNSDETFATGWNKIGTKWYYFDENAILQRGWQDIDGIRYYLDVSTGAMKTGWQTIAGNKYYFTGSGEMLTGWQKITKTVTKTVKKKKVTTKVTNWYCFAEDGHMLKGWQVRGDSWSYLKSDGTAVTGRQTISKKVYYFTSAGVMRRGYIKVGKKTYFAGESGVVGRGWKTWDGVKVYCKSDGTVTTGRAKIGTKYYFFTGSGALRTNTWVKIGKKYYYAGEDGSQVSGWKQLDDNWYYLRAGVRVIGKQTIGGKIYYFNGSGVMRTGTFTIGKVEYMVGEDGAVSSGWKEILVRVERAVETAADSSASGDTSADGSGAAEQVMETVEELIRIYVKADGAIAKGCTKVGRTLYTFDSIGKLTEGWLKYGGKWYYADAAGVAQTGWISIDGKIYYFNSSGVMLTGKQKIGKVTYTFSSGGALIKGKAPSVKATFPVPVEEETEDGAQTEDPAAGSGI